LKIKGLIIVLGSPNSDKGELLSVAKTRCELALKEYHNHSGWKILLTGGYGEHFNKTDKPHTAYLKKYLIERGVSNDAFVEFTESNNTLQDASLSKPIVLKNNLTKLLIVTSDYHFDRAKYIFEREFAEDNINIEFAICKTDEAAFEFNLASQINHEQNSVKRLREQDGLKL